MTNHALRGFSLGILLTASVVFAYFYLFEVDIEDENVERHLNEETIAAEAKKFNQVVISSEEHQKLLSIKKQFVEIRTKTDEKDVNENSKIYGSFLEIKSGMNSMEIAEILEREKIIESKQSFIDYLNDYGLNRSIQIGSYELSSEMSIAEIAKMITKS
jgi:hypothetical protein